MTTLLAILAAVAIGLRSTCDDSPASTTLARIWAAVQAASWGRRAWITVCILGGGLAVLGLAVGATARAGVFIVAVALAAAGARVAKAAALDRSPLCIRLEISA